jgi:GNAT superfamily N-acetyltransferase
MLVIRKATNDDIVEVGRIIHSTISHCYPAIYDPEVIQFFIDHHSPSEIKRRIEGGVVLMLVENKTLRATGFLLGDELGGCYVSPDYQQRGYGTTIVNALLKEARERKCRYLHLDSTPFAKPLYLRAGFELVGPAVIMIGNVPLHYFKMEMYL